MNERRLLFWLTDIGDEYVLEAVERFRTVQHRPRRRLSRLLVIAAVVAALAALGMVAYAVGGFMRHDNPKPIIETFFGDKNGAEGGGQEEHRILESPDEAIPDLEYDVVWPRWQRVSVDETLADELIAPYIAAMGQSLQYEGYVLTVEAMLHDARTGGGLVYYTIENPDGVSGYRVETNGEIWWPPESPVNVDATYVCRHYIDEGATTDTKLSVVGYYVAEPERLAVFPTLDFFITGADRTKRDCVLPLEFCDGGLMAGRELAEGGILLTPISLQINGSVLNLNMHSEPPDITLVYEDGSRYTVVSKGENIQNTGWAVYSSDLTYYTLIFNRIVDTDSVASVIIDATEHSVF